MLRRSLGASIKMVKRTRHVATLVSGGKVIKSAPRFPGPPKGCRALARKDPPGSALQVEKATYAETNRVAAHEF
jgi:hypothetical protein